MLRLVAALALVTFASPVAAAPPSPEPACSAALPVPLALVGVAPGAERRVRAAATAYGARVVGALPALHVVEVAVPSPRALAAVRALPGVEYAEPEVTYRVDDTPGDPLYKRQWALRKVSAPRAWSTETGAGAAVTVAVLDTGADLTHPDLVGTLLTGANLVDPGTPPQDDHMHGTHVAGIVAARTNNRVGVAGVSWAARVLPLKALGANGSGTTCTVVEGILYAAAQGVDVLNMSIGAAGPCPSAVQAALNVAHAAGVLSVAAAGNDGAGANAPESPANCAHTLAVAATDSRDRPAVFSNHGAYVDVAAPGVDILSTVLDPKTGRHFYGAISGTSMAAPMVSGLAALLAARHPDWTPDAIAARIVATAVDLGARGRDDRYGTGRIDADRALR
jgi:subtilisin family serine protease